MIESSSNNKSEEAAADQMIDMLSGLDGVFEDGIICENENQSNTIWKLREGISLATAHHGMVSDSRITSSIDSEV
jgi:hypothetical protein